MSDLQRVKHLFDQIIELEPAEREVFLARACSDDPAMRAEIEELLKLEAESADFLEQPLLLLIPTGLAPTLDLLQPLERIDRYKIEREIGHGGMGVVYLAERTDGEYKQSVALKLVGPSGNSGEIIRRFRQERQILANLSHPNIARLYDGGATEAGWPFLVMEYVDGVPITTYCRDNALTIRQRLDLFQSVCSAVAHAHRRLVIHRDIKPSNILVTADGEVKLLDFGIAKVLRPEIGEDASAATQTGMFLMTPEYASPEQAAQRQVTTASDVYSLGILLFELLTDELPHHFAETPLGDVIHQICTVDVAKPSGFLLKHRNETDFKARERAGSLAGDLDNIVLKAVRKEPDDRYQTVEQLREDIERYLKGEPILARPVRAHIRAWKIIQRNKVLSGMIAVIAALVLIGFVATVWLLRESRLREKRQREQLYTLEIRQSGQDVEEEKFTKVGQVLHRWRPAAGEEERRGFEWYYLWQAVHKYSRSYAHLSPISGLVITSDGELVAAGSLEGKIRVWRTATALEQATFGDHQKPIRSLAISGDDQWLLSGDAAGVVALWELKTGRERLRVHHGDGRVFAVAFSPDGSRFATGSEDATVKLWDAANGRELRTFQGHSNWVQTLAFTPDGKTLITSGVDALYVFWDVETGDKKFTAAAPLLSGIVNLAVSRDGRYLAAGAIDRNVELRRVSDGEVIKILGGHEDFAHHLAFSPDGRTLVSASADQARLWDLETGRLLTKFKAHDDNIGGLVFSPDGKSLYSGGGDKRVRRWEIGELLAASKFEFCGQCRVFSVKFSPDGALLAVGSQSSPLQLWDWRAKKISAEAATDDDGSEFSEIAFSRHGDRLGTVKNAPVAWLLPLPELAPPTPLRNQNRGVARAIAFSPTEDLAATGGDDGDIHLWDPRSGKEMRVLAGHKDYIESLEFSPDGRRLISGGFDRSIKIWDVSTGVLERTLTGHSSPVYALQVSPQGDRLLSGGSDTVLIVWDLASGRELFRCEDHAAGITSVAFTPDGRRFASASADKTVKIWNARTGELLLTLKGHTDQVRSIDFSPDGQTLASGSWDRTVRLWRAATEADVRARAQDP